MKTKLTNTIIFSSAFIICAIVGTISHEYGHIAVAKWYGYETTLHYASMNWYPEGKQYGFEYDFESEVQQYRTFLDSNSTTSTKLLVQSNLDRWTQHALLIRWGGPVQTMLVGTLGLIILYYRRTRYPATNFYLLDWVAIFLSLFWLREAFNLSIQLVKGVAGLGWWAGSGDEVVISRSLGIPPYTLSMILGCIGFIIALFVVFKVVPAKFRIQFLAGGLVGGTLGYVLWFIFWGPLLLP